MNKNYNDRFKLINAISRNTDNKGTTKLDNATAISEKNQQDTNEKFVKEEQRRVALQFYEDLANRKSTRILRENLAQKSVKYLIGYSVICLLLLILDGLFWPKIGNANFVQIIKTYWPIFHLDDGILIAIVGSTAISIIGLVGIILTG